MQKKFTDPIALLMQEHDETLHQLQKLSKASKGLFEKGYSAEHVRQVMASLKFISEEVHHHNHTEEQALFPILERYIEGPTRIMRNDHKELYKNYAKLRKAVTKVIAQKGDSEAVKALAAIGKNVVQIFVNHIHKENYILFPLVQEFLSRHELREVARKMV